MRKAKFSNRNHLETSSFNKFLQELDAQSSNNYSNYNYNYNQSNTINDKSTIAEIMTNNNCTYNNLYFDEHIYNNPTSYVDPNQYVFMQPTRTFAYMSKPVQPKTKVHIKCTINTIDDLLFIINNNPCDPLIEYNIDIQTLHNIKQPLTTLHEMIGMHQLKQNVVDQILFYIQYLHNFDSHSNDFLHTVIYGPPGTGKTEVAKILGDIFAKMGILKKGTFRKVTRADLIGGFLGQTTLKTRDVIKSCLGGVMFIDEAYSLGNDDKKDAYSKECIDTLCEALSEHKDELMVIINGYEHELTQCFFKYNPGLESRFTWRFNVDNYTYQELYLIFMKKVKDASWDIDEDSQINEKWFDKHHKTFKYYGRDIETLFAKTKIAHSRRIFGLDPCYKKKLILSDIDHGLEMFSKHRQTKADSQFNNMLSTMYS